MWSWGPGFPETQVLVGGSPRGPGGITGEELDEACSQLVQAGDRKRAYFLSLQTRELAVGSSTCSTQTASGSVVGPSTRYLPAPQPLFFHRLSSLWRGWR